MHQGLLYQILTHCALRTLVPDTNPLCTKVPDRPCGEQAFINDLTTRMKYLTNYANHEYANDILRTEEADSSIWPWPFQNSMEFGQVEELISSSDGATRGALAAEPNKTHWYKSAQLNTCDHVKSLHGNTQRNIYQTKRSFVLNSKEHSKKSWAASNGQKHKYKGFFMLNKAFL